MFRTITLFVFIYLQNVYANTDIDNTCQTPFHQQGLCKPISECPALSNLLQNRTKTVESFLRMHHCGGVPKIPNVCCPDVVLDIDNLKDGSTQNNLLPNRDICGIGVDNRVIGNPRTLITGFTYTALLKYEKKKQSQEFYCGGTLINERYILTAAHCIRGRSLPKDAKLVSVRLGEHTLETNPDCDTYFGGILDCADPVVDLEVEDAVVHENYNPDDGNQYHDIALVRLKTKVNFTDFVIPICLPEDNNDNYTNEILEWPGWGTFADHAPNNTKLNGIVMVEDSNECSKMLHLNLTENQFCGFIRQSHSYCTGDSGGALFDTNAGKYYKYDYYNDYLAGILSMGSCDRDQPLVFTKVGKYRQWIISKLKP